MNAPRLKKSKTIFKGIKSPRKIKEKPPIHIKKKETKRARQFPKNFRFIPEQMSLKFNWYFVTRFMLFTLTMAMLIVFLDIIITLSTKQQSNTLFLRLQADKRYWSEVVARYPDYKDAYLQLAEDSYQLGETGSTKVYAEKALTNDPTDKVAQQILSQIKK